MPQIHWSIRHIPAIQFQGDTILWNMFKHAGISNQPGLLVHPLHDHWVSAKLISRKDSKRRTSAAVSKGKQNRSFKMSFRPWLRSLWHILLENNCIVYPFKGKKLKATAPFFLDAPVLVLYILCSSVEPCQPIFQSELHHVWSPLCGKKTNPLKTVSILLLFVVIHGWES